MLMIKRRPNDSRGHGRSTPARRARRAGGGPPESEPGEDSGEDVALEMEGAEDDDHGDGRPSPDAAVARGIRLNVGEVFVWQSATGRLFGFVPVGTN